LQKTVIDLETRIAQFEEASKKEDEEKGQVIKSLEKTVLDQKVEIQRVI
jgi:hypothetical protein